MCVLGSVMFSASLLGGLAILTAGLTFYLTHSPSRTTRDRSGLRRQRERERRDYWGYE